MNALGRTYILCVWINQIISEAGGPDTLKYLKKAIYPPVTFSVKGSKEMLKILIEPAHD